MVGLKGDGHVDDSRVDSRDAGDEAHVSILSLPIKSPIVIIIIARCGIIIVVEQGAHGGSMVVEALLLDPVLDVIYRLDVQYLMHC